jgi:hypothetical protein
MSSNISEIKYEDYQEGDIIFRFPSSALVEKMDNWPSYRKLIVSDEKCCDFGVILDKNIYLIEVKDYTRPNANIPKSKDLSEPIAHKFLGGFAALFVNKFSGSPSEKDFSEKVQQCNNLFICVHVEIPFKNRNRSRIKPSSSYHKNLNDELYRKLKSYISSRHNVIVVSHEDCLNKTPWESRLDPNSRKDHIS